MRFAHLVLLTSAGLSAAQEISLKANRLEHVLVLRDVWLNGQGPFRMMVDTGAASSLVRPEVARRLGLRPAYAVEQETVSGVKRVPVAVLQNVRAGAADDRDVEIMITDVRLEGVDGVLGQSWLLRHDYLLDYRGKRLVLDGTQPERGVQAPLRSSDGRPEIAAEVDGRRQELVLDSGAPALVLFGRPGAANLAAMVATNNGSIEAGTGRARVKIGGAYNRLMATVEVAASNAKGLLPASAFGSVYVSNRDGVVVLVP
jgi:predicted aspartyl protease